MRPDRCETCRFYDPRLGEMDGFCRRYPPVAVVWPEGESEAKTDGRFPTVFPFRWCGEWKAIEFPATTGGIPADQPEPPQ